LEAAIAVGRPPRLLVVTARLVWSEFEALRGCTVERVRGLLEQASKCDIRLAGTTRWAQTLGGMQARDQDRIVGSAVEYVEAWLHGDADRMASCLHPALAKRRVVDADSGALALDEAPFGYMTTTAVGGAKPHGSELAVTIFDVSEGIATAKAVSESSVDLLHLARFGDRWLIVNVLWEDRPRADTRGTPPGPRRALDDYASSWFDRDVGRVRAAYHPDFVERREVVPSDGLELEEVTLEETVAVVLEGAPEGVERGWDVEVFCVDGAAASGRVWLGPWQIYVHLGRFGDRWLIVNILYRRWDDR
jgi:hypothetical protein